MSERMSKEVLTVAEMTITKVLLEVHRARASEDQKDAVITQLVSVLESERGFHHSPHYAFGGPVAECAVGRCGVINKALRLAGRM